MTETTGGLAETEVHRLGQLALDLLRAKLSDGPAVDVSAGRPVYHKPTLYHAGTTEPGATIMQRSDQVFKFTFDDREGQRHHWTAVLNQDDLFHLLLASGQLREDDR